ncbi:hypothetical protein [Anaerofustis sp.]|uniref:hypothetical protein n=1 Tax=Anaerofustis sp. TaxID=1872517 RepID=UPI0025BF076E|nr:hypothetical protein [Anaerofustis sp.]
MCEDDGLIVLVILALLLFCGDNNDCGCDGGFLKGLFNGNNIILIILVLFLLFCDDEC